MSNYMTEAEYEDYVSNLEVSGEMPTLIKDTILTFVEDAGLKDKISSARLYKGGDSEWKVILYYKDKGNSLILNHELLSLRLLMVGN